MKPDAGMIFILLIIAMSTIGWTFNNWLRMKHGYAPETRRRGRQGAIDTGAETERKIHLLASENERLTGQISRLEERIAVLERIATDPAERTARAIDALR
jgi:hypothetical protein